MFAGLTTCGTCRFWHGGDPRAGACHRHAPSARNVPFQVARWPETPAMAGCGEGEAKESPAADDALLPKRQGCESCLYWDRPGIGIDPARRGDHQLAWWQKAGWCRRFAPTPGVEIGEHAFWCATHETDHCYDGRPACVPNSVR